MPKYIETRQAGTSVKQRAREKVVTQFAGPSVIRDLAIEVIQNINLWAQLDGEV